MSNITEFPTRAPLEFQLPSYGEGLPESDFAIRTREAVEEEPTSRRWDPIELNQRHEEIIRLAFTGMRHDQIALDLGMSATHVRDLLNSRIGQAKLADLQAKAEVDAIDVTREIAEASKVAMRHLAQVVDGTIPVPATVRVKAAMDILDRAGHAPVRKYEGKFQGYMAHAHAGLSLLKERGRELGVLEATASPV